MNQAISMYTYIEEFAKRPGNGKFPKISRAEVVTGLKERMAKPETVNQAVASLCGPACLAYVILKHLPEMYAAYIMSLYDTGSAKLGKLTVKPSDGCRSVNPTGKVSAVDWVGLASLRDSENANWEYNSPDDQFAGITMPGGLEGWFKALGMTDIREETNLVFTKGTDNLKQAANLYAAGYSVCLFLWGSVITGKIPSVMSTPNHWAVLSRYPLFSSDDTISFQVFTWGAHYVVPPLKRQNFLKAYYGFVAGKWK